MAMELSTPALLVLAVTPGLYLLWYFYKKDEYEPEPMGLVMKTFVAGAMMVFPAALLESWLMVGPFLVTDGAAWGFVFIASFFIIGPVEEYFKLRAVMKNAFDSPEFNEPMDGIVYCSAASLGFASLENIFYVVGTGSVAVGIARAVLSVPGHAFMGVLMGYWVGKAKMEPENKDKYIMVGFLLATVLHGLYDFFILVEPNPLLLMFFLYLFMGTLVKQGKQAIEEHSGNSPFRAELGISEEENVPRVTDRRASYESWQESVKPRSVRRSVPRPAVAADTGPALDEWGDPRSCTSCGRNIEGEREYVMCDECGAAVCEQCAILADDRDLCPACAKEPANCGQCRRDIRNDREYVVCDWCSKPLCAKCTVSDGHTDLCRDCAGSLGFAAG
jgi:RsiW-degrading membrane proteinase PrsW (M82 family)